MFQRIVILGFLAITACRVASAESPPISEKGGGAILFGTPLGITHQELAKLIRDENDRTTLLAGSAKDYQETHFTWDGTIRPTPGKSTTTAFFYDDHIYRVQVALADLSINGREQIKQMIEQKYGPGETKMAPGSFGSSQAKWTYSNHTTQIYICCSWEARLMTISYTDCKVMKQLDARQHEERERRRREDEAALNKPGKNDKIELDKNL